MSAQDAVKAELIRTNGDVSKGKDLAAPWLKTMHLMISTGLERNTKSKILFLNTGVLQTGKPFHV